MKKRLISLACALLCCIGLLSGCRETASVRDYWSGVDVIVDETNYRECEDRFADFAEKAVVAPGEEALAAIDSLFEKLKADEISYYIYSDFFSGAFYNILSPCRNADLFSKAVEHMTSDGIMRAEECEPYVKMRDWMMINRLGEKAIVPGIDTIDTRTLVLVMDLSCPSCREALTTLASEPDYVELRRVAVCCGSGPEPAVPGWEYIYPENAESMFDIHMTPVYYIVSQDGIVETPYTLAQ